MPRSDHRVQLVLSQEDYEELLEMAQERRLPLSVMLREICCRELVERGRK